MGIKQIPLFLWVLGAGLWSLVFVNRCTGDDGSVVAVPDMAAAAPDSAVAAPVAAPVADSASAGEIAGGSVRRKCVDVNLADEKELDALPGVGPAIAARIIDFRSRNGRFAKLADLDAVKGIGPAMLKKLEGRVCF